MSTSRGQEAKKKKEKRTLITDFGEMRRNQQKTLERGGQQDYRRNCRHPGSQGKESVLRRKKG